MKNPKFIIKSIEGKYVEYEDTEFLECFFSQNNLELIDEDVSNKIKIIRKYEMKSKKNYSNIVIDAEHTLYRQFKLKDKLNMDGGNVRCFNCRGYNHFQNVCKNEIVCFKCAGSHYT